jgi:hypothetical protein
MGPIHSPAAVTIPSKKHSKHKDNTQSNRTNKTKNKQQAQTTSTKTAKGKVTGDPAQQTSDEKEVIALYQLRFWYGKKTKKRGNEETQKSHCHTSCD